MQKQGIIIANLLNLAGINQRELAPIIGISEEHLSRELKKDPVPTKTINRIAQFFDVMPNQLFDPTFVPPPWEEGKPYPPMRAVSFTAQEPAAKYEPAAPGIGAGNCEQVRAENAELRTQVKRLLTIIENLTAK